MIIAIKIGTAMTNNKRRSAIFLRLLLLDTACTDTIGLSNLYSLSGGTAPKRRIRLSKLPRAASNSFTLQSGQRVSEKYNSA